MYSTRLFTEKVMPKLQNLWPEFAGSRFWCHPLSQRAEPAPIVAARRA
jgi:hypothetical protein